MAIMKSEFSLLGWFFKSVSLIQIRFDRFRVHVKKNDFFEKKCDFFYFSETFPPWCTGSGVPIRSYGQFIGGL